jgi:hypothetical protein
VQQQQWILQVECAALYAVRLPKLTDMMMMMMMMVVVVVAVVVMMMTVVMMMVVMKMTMSSNMYGGIYCK